MTESEPDYRAAARRCHKDGTLLLEQGRLANASHLFGLGAECALKLLLEGHQGADVKLSHLPELRDHALKSLRRRRDGAVQQLLNSDSYMLGWRIDNRYWPDAAFSEERCKLHQSHCLRTLGAASLGN
ncbi:MULTISPECIES: hypothetical protein [Thiorhodovibrio]|uniref:hypothetical protein n=1 Tax=Thiorhodovibrio TaxID=61593 RepID=UPI001911B1D5|nr:MULTISPECIES: hypothetical protein [Thiorhodovibrio]MBK5967422.1 hypothetical protein [Thiorhodovibrio winogradskyi]WPL12548.1 hypothetical protein Thiosp_02320 [Thiorhodovibrio litoralis]